jgi:hypothetical protein
VLAGYVIYDATVEDPRVVAAAVLRPRRSASSTAVSARGTDAELPVVTVGSPSEPGNFVAPPGGMPLVDAEGAAALAREGVLLNGRRAVPGARSSRSTPLPVTSLAR